MAGLEEEWRVVKMLCFHIVSCISEFWGIFWMLFLSFVD